MNFQDWNEVKWDKRGIRQKDESKQDFLIRAQRNSTAVKTLAKPTSLNKAGSSGVNEQVMSSRKLEDETETFKHKTISLSMAKRLAQKRCEMKLTQKDLAFKLSLPEKIIKDYEASKAIPTPTIINKIEKIVGKIRD